MKKTILLLSVIVAAGILAFPQTVVNGLTGAALQARAWTFTALQTFGNGLSVTSGLSNFTAAGVVSPLKVSKDYTMADPTLAPTGMVTDGTGGSCLTNQSYRFYYGYANESGQTNISPASSPDYTPTSTARFVTFTMPATLPGNAKGWYPVFSTSADSHATRRLCNSALTLDAQLVTGGATTVNCKCAGSLAAPSSNTTGIRRLATINDVAQSKIAFPSFAGGNQNTITENGNVLDLSGTMPAWNGATLAAAAPQTFTICSSGCNYTTLTAACAANTATPSAPITYLIGPGHYTYTGPWTCNGQNTFSILGAAPDVTYLERTDGGYGTGAIELGNTDANLFIGNMSLKAYNGLVWNRASGGGNGVNKFWNLSLYSRHLNSDEDCALISSTGAGTRDLVSMIRCDVYGDGLTWNTWTTNDSELHGSNNYFYSATGTVSLSRAMAMNGAPCYATFTGDRFDVTAGLGSSNIMRAYGFDPSAAGCGTSAKIVINSPSIVLSNTSAPGSGGSAEAIQISPLGAQVVTFGDITVNDATISVTNTDSTGGSTYGLFTSGVTNGMNIYFNGGKIRTSGGLAGSIKDIRTWHDGATNEAVSVNGTDYQTELVEDGTIAGAQTLMSQSGTCTFPGGGTTCAVTLPQTEPVTTYRVVLGCNANKTFWVTSKATGGFTINASGTSSDSCDWRLAR